MSNTDTAENFWNTDLDKLPWALRIDDNTPIVRTFNGIPIETYTQNEVGKWVDHILNWWRGDLIVMWKVAFKRVLRGLWLNK